MFVIEVPFASPAYADSLALRDDILRKPLNMVFKAADLELEYDSIHLVCYDDNYELLACLVLKPRSDTEVKMRQVAVRADLQEQGIGRFLVEESEAFAKKRGFSEMVLNARETAVPFYLKLDYEKIGARFEEVNIPHFKMRKGL